MKKYYRMTACLCALLLAGASCTQPVYEEKTEEETKEEESQRPSPDNNTDRPEDLPDEDYDLLEWTGDTHKFKIEDGKSVQLYDPSEQAGTAQLTAAVKPLRESCWLLRIKVSYNPSANNFTRFYLAASTPDLFNKEIEGYFVQVGGNYDHVYFCRQKGERVYKLFTAEDVLQDSNNSEVDLKIECDKNGYFTIQCTTWTTQGTYMQQHVVKDTVSIPSPYCGIRCTYTKTRHKHTLYRWIRVHHNVDSYEELEPV